MSLSQCHLALLFVRLLRSSRVASEYYSVIPASPLCTLRLWRVLLLKQTAWLFHSGSTQYQLVGCSRDSASLAASLRRSFGSGAARLSTCLAPSVSYRLEVNPCFRIWCLSACGAAERPSDAVLVGGRRCLAIASLRTFSVAKWLRLSPSHLRKSRWSFN